MRFILSRAYIAFMCFGAGWVLAEEDHAQKYRLVAMCFVWGHLALIIKYVWLAFSANLG